MAEEWLDNSLDPAQKLEALELENSRMLQQLESLRDFSQRIDRNLSDPKLYQVMLDEFLIHCQADRVVILVQDEIEKPWITHIQSCDPNVKSVLVPYVNVNCEGLYFDYLEEVVKVNTTQSVQWNEAIRVHEDIFIQRCMAAPFQVEGEFGSWLICLQWVGAAVDWESKVQPLFENMTQYAQAIVDQRQMRVQIEELQNQEQTFLDLMPSALVAIDILGNITLWSGKSEEYFGMKLAEVIGASWAELLPEFKVVESRIPELMDGSEPITLQNLEFEGKKYNCLMYGLIEMGRGEIGLRLDLVK